MPTPDEPTPPLCVLPVAQVREKQAQPRWLIEELWTQQAVGVLGGPPKVCKTFLALEMALAIASGAPCLGRYRVTDPGPVLLFAAEDAPHNIRQRLHGLAQARRLDFHTLPVLLILADTLRLDLKSDLQRLSQAVDTHRPRLLILDPFVRLHRGDENSSREISALLADLRALQRRFAMAILLVHHTRKTNGQASGQDLRGSGDLYAWSDANLYLHRRHQQLGLTVEHRAAKAPQPVTLTLAGEPPRLTIDTAPESNHPHLQKQLLDLLRRHQPLTQAQLRDRLKVRNQTLTDALRQLRDAQKITRTHNVWTVS
jgi:hypothetical protein